MRNSLHLLNFEFWILNLTVSFCVTTTKASLTVEFVLRIFGYWWDTVLSSSWWHAHSKFWKCVTPILDHDKPVDEMISVADFAAHRNHFCDTGSSKILNFCSRIDEETEYSGQVFRCLVTRSNTEKERSRNAMLAYSAMRDLFETISWFWAFVGIFCNNCLYALYKTRMEGNIKGITTGRHEFYDCYQDPHWLWLLPMRCSRTFKKPEVIILYLISYSCVN